MKYIGLNRSRI